jgi:hypothetical protein
VARGSARSRCAGRRVGRRLLDLLQLLHCCHLVRRPDGLMIASCQLVCFLTRRAAAAARYQKKKCLARIGLLYSDLHQRISLNLSKMHKEKLNTARLYMNSLRNLSLS